MWKGYIYFVIMGLITPWVLSKHIQFYRKDYTYFDEFDAFYKVHWDLNGLSWSSAFQACDGEGSTLFYPKGDEWQVVKNLTDAMPVAPNSSEIFVGLHDQFGIGEFITIDGHATETPLNAVDVDPMMTGRCMMMDFTTGALRVDECLRFEPAAFVCKKVDTESCPTIDHEYKYAADAKKCYKVNQRPKTWQDAMQTCYMEGGVLAIIGDTVDVRSLMEGSKNYFIGFKMMFNYDFYTVKGQKFENSNFKNWYEPNNANYQGKECGIIRFEPYNSVDRVEAGPCQIEQPFICEMEARL